MRSFGFERWDGGRLTVNREHAPLLRAHALTTFDSLMRFDGGDVAKCLLRERTTVRITLAGQDGTRAFYLKRHTPPPWKEYVKPLLRLRRPILGARNEWEAILRFHRAGLPTMVPVALGQAGRDSFLLTEAIEGCEKLSHWLERHHAQNGRADRRAARRLVERVAQLARDMHAAGMHHQDFYLTHLLLDEGADALYLIDLGRVRAPRRLARRWIVKDLAQLNYSARLASRADRARFLRAYLGRPPGRDDAALLRRIERKSAAIARHSRRHAL